MPGLSLNLRNARLQQIVDALDAAATPGRIVFYSDPQPDPGDAPGAANAQAEVILADPCGVVAAGTLTFEPEVEGLRIDDEEITWARFNDGDGNFVMDMTVTLVGAIPPGEIQLTTVTGLVGGFVRIVEPSTISE